MGSDCSSSWSCQLVTSSYETGENIITNHFCTSYFDFILIYTSFGSIVIIIGLINLLYVFIFLGYNVKFHSIKQKYALLKVLKLMFFVLMLGGVSF